MSRRAIDPVERAFVAWVSLTAEDQQRFEDRRAGYRAAMGMTGAESPKPRVRAHKKKAATEAEG